ncbi:MAG TPA: phosphate signaling complex protein PhoU [Steroidobacteraceae bacterium]|nr:phosphate signaling complex protein PhoU [Steroidobacteraceae bacterium]
MEKSELGHHIVSRYNEELEKLRGEVLNMGGLIESQLRSALVAFEEGNTRLSHEVVGSEYRVNLMEMEIDSECNRILATRAPAASDLRLVVAIIKTITDMERIGDEAHKIGQIGLRHSDLVLGSDRRRMVRHLGRAALELLRQSLDCFARRDAQAALAAVKRDRILDEEFDAIQRQCITFMIEDPRTIRVAIDLMWIARSLERVGDHAKNICEYVVYMVYGRDVRHTSIEDVEKELGAQASRQDPAPPLPASAASSS